MVLGLLAVSLLERFFVLLSLLLLLRRLHVELLALLGLLALTVLLLMALAPLLLTALALLVHLTSFLGSRRGRGLGRRVELAAASVVLALLELMREVTLALLLLVSLRIGSEEAVVAVISLAPLALVRRLSGHCARGARDVAVRETLARLGHGSHVLLLELQTLLLVLLALLHFSQFGFLHALNLGLVVLV